MHYKVLRYFLVLALTGMAGAPLTWAQPGDHIGGGFHDKLLDVKRSQLGPALGADQGTVNRLLAIDQKYNPLRDQCRKEAIAAFHNLQQLMRNPSPPEEQVRSVLDTMLQKEQEMLSMKQRQLQEERAVLTPIQHARYILYLKNLMKEARSIKGGPGETAPMSPRGLREIPVSRPPQ